MQAHAHSHLYALRPTVTGERPLARDRGSNRVTSSGKRNEEPVALRSNLATFVLVEGVAKDAVMFSKHLGVAPAQAPQHPNRALDVAEQEDDVPLGSSSMTLQLHRTATACQVARGAITAGASTAHNRTPRPPLADDRGGGRPSQHDAERLAQVDGEPGDRIPARPTGRPVLVRRSDLDARGAGPVG
jgi:hypothetical protein